MWDACLDLFLGSSCVGCGRPGRLLCVGCAADLPRSGSPAWPSPCPPGLALPLAGGAYDGLLKVMVNAHKERARLALAGPLGAVLAAVAADLARELGGAGPLVLVPVPSRGAVVRRRGHDPLLRVCRHAAARLRRGGTDAVVLRALRQVTAPRDQAGLDARARRENLHGSMAARPAALRWGGLRREGARVVVVDDVVTTGATVAEAQRALTAAGVSVQGIAAVAATRRRADRSGPVRQPRCRLPFSSAGD